MDWNEFKIQIFSSSEMGRLMCLFIQWWIFTFSENNLLASTHYTWMVRSHVPLWVRHFFLLAFYECAVGPEIVIGALLHVCTHTHTCSHAHTCTHMCIHKYVYTYTQKCIHTHTEKEKMFLPPKSKNYSLFLSFLILWLYICAVLQVSWQKQLSQLKIFPFRENCQIKCKMHS